jgi:ABC-type nitrate/sulfonate/bicarbonate transport system ATPase subunit
MPNAVLEAHDLTLSWDGDYLVTREISLAVDAGEILVLVGRSGCGKTTILHALAGLTRPVSGQVLLRGEDVTGVPGRVSYMLQKDLLLPNLRVIDNACLPLTIAGTPREAARARVRELLGDFGLEGVGERWPSELSGGMRQRVAFLRTYLMGNDVVLLDEPFSALDALTRTQLRGWFCATARELGLAVVAITHDVDEAVSMADRVKVLAGNPAAGVPSSIVADVVPERPAGLGDEQFALTEGYLQAKRAVLAALGEG